MNIYAVILFSWIASLLIATMANKQYWFYAALSLSWFSVIVPLINAKSFIQLAFHCVSFAVLIYILSGAKRRGQQLLRTETQPKQTKLEILAFVAIALISYHIFSMFNSPVAQFDVAGSLKFNTDYFRVSCLYMVLAAVIGAVVRSHFGLILLATNLVNASILGANLIPEWYDTLMVLITFVVEAMLIIFVLILSRVPAIETPCDTESMRLMRG